MSLRSFFARLVAPSRSWIRSLLHRNRLEAEMEAELAFHLESLTADLIRAGHAPAEAARRARIALGAATVAKEGMRASLGLRWWDEFRADLRYAIRILRKSPRVHRDRGNVPGAGHRRQHHHLFRRQAVAL